MKIIGVYAVHPYWLPCAEIVYGQEKRIIKYELTVQRFLTKLLNITAECSHSRLCFQTKRENCRREALETELFVQISYGRRLR